MTRHHFNEFDVIVIGGGIVGSAIAWGLAKIGQKVAVLDEGDNAFRASRGNFALVWVQGKGLGMSAYAAWTIKSVRAWAEFADQLYRQTGVDLHLQQNGGFYLALSESELERRHQLLNQLHSQPAMQRYDYEILSHGRVKTMLPAIGSKVAGGCYCPLDGHVNSLKLFRALHSGMQMFGAVYKPNHAVESIGYRHGEFCILGVSAELRAPKVVLAAGLGNARLAPMAGLAAPVRPQRGQLIVTEKTAPFMPYPVMTVRQTDEGGVMVGDSQEEAGFSSALRHEILSVMAERAVCMFPHLGRLNVVRGWASLRIMTEDGFPIYDHSMQCLGAFIATCHSGVTLAANHALILAPLIARGELPADELSLFSARRFNVSTVV